MVYTIYYIPRAQCTLFIRATVQNYQVCLHATEIRHYRSRHKADRFLFFCKINILILYISSFCVIISLFVVISPPNVRHTHTTQYYNITRILKNPRLNEPYKRNRLVACSVPIYAVGNRIPGILSVRASWHTVDGYICIEQVVRNTHHNMHKANDEQ